MHVRTLGFRKLISWVPKNLEVVWIKIRPHRLPRTVSVLFYAIVYFPPNSSNEDELIDHLLESYDYICTNFPEAGVTTIGDLNRLDTNQICAGNNLVQVVDKPTRKDAILDKILTNISDYYLTPEISVPIGTSDHDTVIWTSKSTSSSHSNEQRKRVVRPMAESSIRDFGQWIQNHDWPDVYAETTTIAKCDAFYRTLNDALNMYIPCKTVRLHNEDKPWMTNYIKDLIQKRQKVFHKEHRSCRWKRLRNKVKHAIIKAKKDYYRDRVQRHKKANPAQWYQQIKVMANLNKIDAIIQPPSHVDSTDFMAVADVINDHFVSISSDLRPLSITDLPSYRPDPHPSPSVMDYEVYNMLRRTKAGKAGGPDGISARIVREFAYELSKPLADIYIKKQLLPRRSCATAVEESCSSSNSQGKACKVG